MGIDAIDRYSPVIVLLLGLGTYCGMLGVGLLLQAAIRLRMPSPWRQVVGLAAGICVVSLLIQVAGMAGVATKGVLIGIWVVALVCGVVSLPWVGPLTPPRAEGVERNGAGWIMAALACAALGVMLLIAIAPSTRIDELYYHMVVPSRIVADGALRFYREPWEGAILPQMVYQIAAAPLHAMGYRDASNVVSWCVAVTFAWFAWYLVAERTGRRAWAALVAAGVVAGMGPATLYTAAGAHAPGDFLSCAAIVAVLFADELRRRVGAGQTAVAIGLLVTGMVASKVSLGPVATLCVIVAAVRLGWDGGWAERLRVLAGLIAPGLILYAPLAVWTWWASGSPLGPMLAGKLGPTVYDETIERLISGTFSVNAVGPLVFIKEMAMVNSGLLWLAIAGFLVCRQIPGRVRLLGAALLGFQVILVWMYLTHSVRFLGGVPYALAIAFAMSAAGTAAWVSGRLVAAIVAAGVLVLPWLAVEGYYAKQFLPALAGGERRENFYEEKVALVRDYRELDRLLPKDAVIIFTDPVRLSTVYCPRLMVLDPRDVPPGRPCFQMKLRGDSIGPEAYQMTGWTVGETVYENDHAVVATFRTPGRKPETAGMWVRRVSRG